MTEREVRRWGREGEGGREGSSRRWRKEDVRAAFEGRRKRGSKLNKLSRILVGLMDLYKRW